MESIAKELHRPARRKYTRRRVTLKGIHDLYQIDLAEVIPYAKANKGMKYILTMNNCFTKFALAVPLKTKTGVEVAKALGPILKKHKMKHIQTDQGKEWFNIHVKKLMEKYGINHYATHSEMKASIVERFNRTLKERMWRTFTAQGNYRWLSILPKLVNEYNNSVHSTIGMKPKDVRQKHVKTILARINIKAPPVGDSVRISKYKRIFTKEYLPNWTNEVFRVYAVKPTKPVTYILQDSKGGFYEQELNKSTTDDVYLVDKILKRKRGQVLVRWQGHDKKHDSWVPTRNILRR